MTLTKAEAKELARLQRQHKREVKAGRLYKRRYAAYKKRQLKRIATLKAEIEERDRVLRRE